MTDNVAPAAAAASLASTKKVTRGQVVSWALWDWASAAFNAVITTFVFTVYLTSGLFLDPGLTEGTPAYEAGLAGLSSSLGLALAVAGLCVAVVAPVLGQRSDASGRRRLWLGVNTAVVVLATALLFLVEASPSFFVLGLVLIAVGNIFFEFASVNYNAMLVQVSTPATIGKVSGLGWGSGYLGGIVLLLILYVGFIAGDTHWFGVTDDNGLNIRIVALLAAAWTLLFSLPVLFAVPEIPSTSRRDRVSFFASYGLLFRDIRRLYRESRHTFYFLLASAVFRDGLAGVFTFGGVIAAVTFGFSSGDVLIFAIAANVVAGAGTIVAGLLDDRFGAKPLIVTALIGLVITGTGVFLARDAGPIAFWIGGLLLCLFVGPAQSASRSFLARVTPPGREGEIFGLYATTGRAVSFLAPGLFALLVSASGEQAFGILGIVLVLLAGLVLLLPVKANPPALV